MKISCFISLHSFFNGCSNPWEFLIEFVIFLKAMHSLRESFTFTCVSYLKSLSPWFRKSLYHTHLHSPSIDQFWWWATYIFFSMTSICIYFIGRKFFIALTILLARMFFGYSRSICFIQDHSSARYKKNISILRTYTV